MIDAASNAGLVDCVPTSMVNVVTNSAEMTAEEVRLMPAAALPVLWAPPPLESKPSDASAPIQINAQTVRQIVHTSIGGKRVRARFSNAYGTSGLVIGAAHVAISAGGAPISGGTDRVLTFNGPPTIPSPAVRWW